MAYFFSFVGLPGWQVSRSCTFLILICSLLMTFPVVSLADEDVLRLLVWEGYAPEECVQNFEHMIEEKYGRKITLEVSYPTSSTDFYAPIRMKEVDLVSLTHHHFKDDRFNYIANGLLIPVNIKNISRYNDLIPELRDAEYLLDSNDIYGVPVCQGLYALAYSTTKVKPAPTSWQVLWEPEHHGAYTIGANEFLYNVCTTALALGYSKESIARYDDLNNDVFKAHLRALVMNAGGFWVGVDKAEDLSGRNLSAGWGDCLSVLRSQGEDWQFADPVEGSICWIDSYAITWTLEDKPFLKQVAEEWIDFLLKPDFQVNHVIYKMSQKPVTSTVGAFLTDDEKERLQISDIGYFCEINLLLPTYTKRDRNGIQLLWNKAMEGIEIKSGKE